MWLGGTKIALPDSTWGDVRMDSTGPWDMFVLEEPTSLEYLIETSFLLFKCPQVFGWLVGLAVQSFYYTTTTVSAVYLTYVGTYIFSRDGRRDVYTI